MDLPWPGLAGLGWGLDGAWLGLAEIPCKQNCHEVSLQELSRNENQARFKKSMLLLSPEEFQQDHASRSTVLEDAREVIVTVDGKQIRCVCVLTA